MPTLIRKLLKTKENVNKAKKIRSEDSPFEALQVVHKEMSTAKEKLTYLPKTEVRINLNNFIKNLPVPWKIWILRGIFSVLLICYFWLTIYLGPVVIMTTILAIQVKCFAEIIDIGYKVYPVNEPPLFKLVSWYFLVAANYFCYGETLVDYFYVFINKFDALKLLVNYHRFFSFCMYFVGIMWFVLSLRRKYGMHQFSLLACTHVVLLLVVTQSYMIVRNIFQGLIWLTVSVTSVVCNDIMAYIFGKFFGKTPLIQVSPKKTWEGFIGAGISTVLYGCAISYALCRYPYFVCPLEYVEKMNMIQMDTECEPPEMFQLKNYSLALNIPRLFHVETNLAIYPFIFHALVLSLFSSIIAPFGGFFASGFKRAFEVKDFGGAIPGHGGVLDRFDCQFLMATFVNVYITSFINNYTPEKIYSKVLYLEEKQQVQFFQMLKESLKSRNSF